MVDYKPDALSELVRAHWREVYAMLVTLVRHAATAEDLAQEVFLVAYRKQMRPGPGVRLWLREVARRLTMNELRRKRPARMTPDELQDVLESLPSVDSADTPLAFDEELVALRLCLAELPESDRALLAARYEHDEPLDNVATRTGQSVGYLKQRLYRLRHQLAKCIRRRVSTTER